MTYFTFLSISTLFGYIPSLMLFDFVISQDKTTHPISGFSHWLPNNLVLLGLYLYFILLALLLLYSRRNAYHSAQHSPLSRPNLKPITVSEDEQ